MRRPILPILFIQCLVILILLEGFGLDLYSTGFTPYYDTVQSIEGRVKTVQIKTSYIALTVDLGNENILVRLKGITDERYIFDLVGRKISATGKITKPDARRNPGLFDYQKYLNARNIHAIMDVSKFKFSPGKILNPLSHYISVQKGIFFSNEKTMVDSTTFSLISGIVFGEKGYLDEDLYKEFQDSGMAHVLAVSGLHVGLVYEALRKLLKRRDKTASLITLVLLLIYASLANFSVSVIRAAGMIFLHIMAMHLNRRYDMLSAASFIAIILLSVNPYYIYDSGAQLSFLAAFSLAVINPYFELKIKKYCDKVKKDSLLKLSKWLLPGLSLQIGMAPLMCYHFLNFAPFSLLINPIAIYLSSLFLPLGLLAFLCYPFKIVLAGFSMILEVLSFLLTKLSFLSNVFLGSYSVPAPSIEMLSIYYLLIFFYFSEFRFILLRTKKEKLVALISASLIGLGSLMPFTLGLSQSILPWAYNTFDFVFLDVGQGDSSHIHSGNVNVLIDGGGSLYKDIAAETLKPYLLKNGITHIDLAIVSHLDLDHSKGIEDLSKIFKIKTIAFPISAKGEDVSDFKADEIIYLSAGDIVNLPSGKIKVLSANGKDGNEGSIICQAKVKESSALYMADVPINKELNLTFPKVDILKVGHHGSKTSTSKHLLAEAMPSLAVISCGKNNRYGHPNQSVLEELENSGIIIKRIDYEGAICIKNKNILTKY